MNNNQAIEKIAKYGAVNANVKPTKGTDSGATGKAFEGQVKLYLNGKISSKNLVSSKAKIDLTKKGLKIEVKSGCGTLDGIEKNDYVVYSPDATIENARAYTPAVFLDILNVCGLIRTKKATSGATVKAIQSFKNSKRKSEQFTSLLEQCGIEMETFKQLF